MPQSHTVNQPTLKACIMIVSVIVDFLGNYYALLLCDCVLLFAASPGGERYVVGKAGEPGSAGPRGEPETGRESSVVGSAGEPGPAGPRGEPWSVSPGGESSVVGSAGKPGSEGPRPAELQGPRGERSIAVSEGELESAGSRWQRELARQGDARSVSGTLSLGAI